MTAVTKDKDQDPTCRCHQAGTTCRVCRMVTLHPICQDMACHPTPYPDLKAVVTTLPLQLLLLLTPATLLLMECLILLRQCLCLTVSSSRTISRGMAACRHCPPVCTAAAGSVAAGAGPVVAAVHALHADPLGGPTAGPPDAGLLQGSTENTNVHTHLGGNDVTQDRHEDKLESIIFSPHLLN